MDKINVLILTIAIAITFTVSTILTVERKVWRNVDDEIKIEQVKHGIEIENRNAKIVESQRKAKECIDAGGIPEYFGDRFDDCKQQKK